MFMPETESQIKTKRSHSEKRWKERLDLKETVSLKWSDRYGSLKSANCKCRDISRTGMLLLVPERIELRAFVHVHAPSLGLVGQASVRHRKPEGFQFVTGLEFLGGLCYTKT